MGEDLVSAPRRVLNVFDVVCIVVGIVIGVGIFRSPGEIAKNTPNASWMLLAWLIGGLLCIAGSLCYAELASTYPYAGGDYIYLKRAYGRFVGFAFVWARLSVIQTGSIVALAYAFGDYMSNLISLGKFSSTIYAALITLVLTAINVIGVQQGKWTQNVLTTAKVLALLSIVALGLLFPSRSLPAAPGEGSAGLGRFNWAAFGLAMVFVLYTYGGWNEVAFVAGELKDAHRNMVRAIVASMLTLTAIYVLVNIAYLRLLSFERMRDSAIVASDAVSSALGKVGGRFVSAFVAISALGATNGTIFTGAANHKMRPKKLGTVSHAVRGVVNDDLRDASFHRSGKWCGDNDGSRSCVSH